MKPLHHSTDTVKANNRVLAAAWTLIQSEIPSLRHRIGDGYAVVEVAALERLLKAYNAARAKRGP